jgi:SH3-like domain-containing protein
MRAFTGAAATAVMFSLSSWSTPIVAVATTGAAIAITAPTEAFAKAKITVRPKVVSAVVQCKTDHAKLWTQDGRVFAVGECWRSVGFVAHTD